MSWVIFLVFSYFFNFTIFFNFLSPLFKSLSSAGLTSPASNSEQQCGHFVAVTSTVCLQYGHARVVTAFLLFILLTVRTIKNAANIVIRKLITVFKNRPMFKVVAPAAWASATVLKCAPVPPESTKNHCEKSTPPIKSPIGGIMTSATSELTTLVITEPTMIPMAMSIALPRSAKSRNSFKNLLMFCSFCVNVFLQSIDYRSKCFTQIFIKRFYGYVRHRICVIPL